MNNSEKPKLNIISFIVGLLVGAIISTGSIYFYTLAANTNSNDAGAQQSMQNPGTPPNGENGGPNGENGGGTPPNGEGSANNMRQNQ